MVGGKKKCVGKCSRAEGGRKDNAPVNCREGKKMTFNVYSVSSAVDMIRVGGYVTGS